MPPQIAIGNIYAKLQQPQGFELFGGRRYIAATKHLHALFIDVTEITDRTQNALNMVGDIYAARLFHLAGARLGLAPWKRASRTSWKRSTTSIASP